MARNEQEKQIEENIQQFQNNILLPDRPILSKIVGESGIEYQTVLVDDENLGRLTGKILS